MANISNISAVIFDMDGTFLGSVLLTATHSWLVFRTSGGYRGACHLKADLTNRSSLNSAL